ncbi:palmitoyltransferase for Vac8p [Arachnomyces sp. PD_36]|nr:palmitoyltransferase for Vac8p [Arachnomyces sp. PD_36]
MQALRAEDGSPLPMASDVRVTAHWIWAEIFSDSQYLNVTMPVNVVLLAVISGIIGLVLTGFTAWHISLAFRGMTTIECLEKTRYLSPLRKSLDRERAGRRPGGHCRPGSFGDHGIGQTLQGFGQQVIDSHANAIPGVTREEEGEERPSPTLHSHDMSSQYRNTYNNPTRGQYDPQSPAQQSLYQSYGELERARERERYEDYLDDRDSEKLPHAFDLGWRRNLQHLFGEKPLLWFLPICNTTGDGWKWEASNKWIEARERIRHERTQEYHQPQEPPVYGTGRFHDQPQQRNNYPSGRSEFGVPRSNERPGTGVSMKTLRPMSPRPGYDTGDMENDSDRFSAFSADDDEMAPEDEERRALNPSGGPLN